jgi:hypothetical protein
MCLARTNCWVDPTLCLVIRSDKRRTLRESPGAADSTHEDSGPERNHDAAKCEYEPTQRPLPPPSLTTCDVASVSSR